MIFSTKNCPICNQKLIEEKVIDDYLGNHDWYLCQGIETVRNIANTSPTLANHYEARIYNINKFATMILPPYELSHTEAEEVTSIYLVSPLEPKKYICSMPLLDMDYSRPQHVISRLKILVTFS